MPTVRLVLEYDGSRYAGWQRQPDQPTIQEAVETALFQLTQETVSVIGAGRTDAGVHASVRWQASALSGNGRPASGCEG